MLSCFVDWIGIFVTLLVFKIVLVLVSLTNNQIYFWLSCLVKEHSWLSLIIMKQLLGLGQITKMKHYLQHKLELTSSRSQTGRQFVSSTSWWDHPLWRSSSCTSCTQYFFFVLPLSFPILINLLPVRVICWWLLVYGIWKMLKLISFVLFYMIFCFVICCWQWFYDNNFWLRLWWCALVALNPK